MSKMAPPENQPPDKVDLNFYKCHKKKSVSIVLCVICGGVYDKSCFERYSKKKYISEHMGICPEHDLTSNCDESTLNEEARELFIQMRMCMKASLRQEILSEIEQDNVSDARQEEEEDQIADNKYLKKENKLLKIMIEEMRDKNEILKNHLEIVQKVKVKTYSQVLNTEPPTQKRVPKIVVKKKDKADGNDLKKYVTHYLNKEKSIQTKKVIFKNESEIIISCMNEASVIETEKTLNKKLTSFCNIIKEDVKKPRIKIVGIDNYEKMDLKALEDDINTRNFKKLESNGIAVHSFANKKTNLQSVIMEVTSEIYKHIRENKDRVFVGFQNCKVYDDLNLQPCFNCGRFGHNGNKCRNVTVCLKCAGEHSTVNCRNTTELCCVNCNYSNNRYNTKYDTKHVANDSQNCTILEKKIKKYITDSDYPMSPIIGRYIGKVDFARAEVKNSRNTRTTSASSLSSLSPRSNVNAFLQKAASSANLNTK